MKVKGLYCYFKSLERKIYLFLNEDHKFVDWLKLEGCLWSSCGPIPLLKEGYLQPVLVTLFNKRIDCTSLFFIFKDLYLIFVNQIHYTFVPVTAVTMVP